MTAHRQSKGLGVRPLLSSVFLRAQSDERLSALAKGGNRHAFAVIFERYASELRAHAARVVRPDRAEDVVQQAMLASWSALLDGAEVREVRAWLHRIVHNAALSTITKRGYDEVEIPASTAAPTLTEELAAGRLSVAEALAALARLPESQRAALTLTAVEGHSGSHAAQAMGLSENAFRQLVYRARSGVRSAISTITPLPLLNWAEGGTGAPEAVGLGLGSLATTAKICRRCHRSHRREHRTYRPTPHPAPQQRHPRAKRHSPARACSPRARPGERPRPPRWRTREPPSEAAAAPARRGPATRREHPPRTPSGCKPPGQPRNRRETALKPPSKQQRPEPSASGLTAVITQQRNPQPNQRQRRANTTEWRPHPTGQRDARQQRSIERRPHPTGQRNARQPRRTLNPFQNARR